MKFDIPLNITVVATNEQKAETQVMEFLIKAIREFGIEHRIADFQYFEFLNEVPSGSRCGNHNHKQGESTHTKQSTCNCSKQSCC